MPDYEGKKPDWIIFCDEGVIFIECKATKYSQDIYEHGINAKTDSMGFIRQIHTAIVQLNEFEAQISSLSEKCGFGSSTKKVVKLIVSFEPLLGLKKGPIRDWVEEKKKEEGYKMDWNVIWIGELEEIQPYISKGANFWDFLTDFGKKNFELILEEMRLRTGSNYAEGILHKYENKIFDELLINMPSKK